MTPSRDEWHLDKKVPIGLLGGLILQTIVITAWFTARFENVDNRLGNLEKVEQDQKNHDTRITILEQQFGYIRSDLGEIKTLLRRQLPPPGSQE
jgi:hypothetical protein